MDGSALPFLIAMDIFIRSLHKQISALNPIDVLDHLVGALACELLRAVDDLVEAHSG